MAFLLVAAGWLTPLRAFSSGGSCGASLVVFASAVAMQGRLFGVCMSHNQSIASLACAMKVARGSGKNQKEKNSTCHC